MPNDTRLSFRTPTTPKDNVGLDTEKGRFVIGETYDISFLVDSDRVAVAIDGVVEQSIILGHLDSREDVWTYVSDQAFHPSPSSIRHAELKNNEVLYPGRVHCKNSPAGEFSTDNWHSPVQSYQPCP